MGCRGNPPPPPPHPGPPPKKKETQITQHHQPPARRPERGADHVTAYGGIDERNVAGLVDGAIFTRGANDKKNTAIFIGGGNLPQGESVLAAVRAKFFAKFGESILFGSKGC